MVLTTSSLVVCPADDLRAETGWDGADGSSRNQLLADLSSTCASQNWYEVANVCPESISPSVMIPEHRLATLLDQVKQSQISKCHYHNPTSSLSLFADHACDRSQFPLQAVHQITQSAEVWFLEFSHYGSRLATSGQDRAIIIYDALTFKELHSLNGHGAHIAYVAWSPDDSKLISCSQDKTARVWDTDVRRPFPTFFAPSC